MSRCMLEVTQQMFPSQGPTSCQAKSQLPWADNCPAWGAFSVMRALVHSDHLALPFSKPQEISSGPAAARLPQPHPTLRTPLTQHMNA